MPSHPTFSFPGVQQPQGFNYTRSIGITPGIITLDMVPQSTPPAATGNFVMQQDNTVIVLPECRVNKAQAAISQSGNVVTLQIYDRRWRWAFGEISGHYNRRNSAGNLIPETEKPPQELATLLLQAMGEQGFDVSQLPNNARPNVEWSFANPARELQSLAEMLGCFVVLGLDDNVRLLPIGNGAMLPSGGAQNADFTYDPPEAPDSLKFVGGPTRFQARFKLEAVGLDLSGEIKPINDLSYTPADGWKGEFPEYFDGVITDADRKRAMESVWKWYRVVSMADGSMNIPGYGAVESLKQVLPLEDGLVETHPDELTNEKQAKPAVIRGIFYSPEAEFENTSGGTEYKGGFSINGEFGIVQFNEPVYKLSGSDNSEMAPADLVLEVAFSVYDADTREPERYTKELNLGGTADTGPEIVSVPEVVKTVRATYSGTANSANVTGTVTNETTDNLPQNADYYLNAALAKYETSQPGDVSYAGFQYIDIDGAVQQVSWSMNDKGATTRASRQNEHSYYVQPYIERRRREKLEGLVDKTREASERGVQLINKIKRAPRAT